MLWTVLLFNFGSAKLLMRINL